MFGLLFVTKWLQTRPLVELENGSIPVQTGQVGQFGQAVAAPGLTEHGPERGITGNK